MDSGVGYTNHALRASVSSIPGEYRSTSENGSETLDNNVVYTIPMGAQAEDQQKTPIKTEPNTAAPPATEERAKWGNDIEFLMSCIALSVGLGNVWRFPFTALENGGGAFVIPYLIVLFLVGRPVYYLEMLLGQFSSRGSVKVFDFCPIMRGVGYGQVFSTAIVTTYYATLMALTLRYFFDSFATILPWTYCREEWAAVCIDSTSPVMAGEDGSNVTTLEPSTPKVTSAELYFTNVILREKDSIDDGLGEPSWSLALTLALSWIIVAIIMIKGVKSSGKASYFLALFPYVVLVILLIRSLTLPGAFDGVMYFIRPQWDKLLEPKVWYAAVTQVFFSLAICFGNIINYASYNRFGHNVRRDSNIVTSLDTFTSMLSGVVIFGILGNLAYESNTTDIQSVVKGGTGLAFISYPDAIAKFEIIPQFFSVLFFLMLFVLGIGSNMAMASCVMTVLQDQFTKTKEWKVVIGIVIVAYLLGLIYITPGGQYILNLVDFYGVSFVALVLAIFQLLAIGWFYGVKRFCRDTEFMLGIRTSIYYRLCWGLLTPALMFAILMYTLVNYAPLEYQGYTYRDGMYVFGWFLSALGIGQLIAWGIRAVWKQPEATLMARIRQSFRPKANWGPMDPKLLKEYKQFIAEAEAVEVMFRKNSLWHRFYDNIFG